jgi:DNA primase
MANRGIEARTIKDFGIGYADGEWDSLYKELLAKGVDTKIMAELGLISNSKGKYFDKYRDRIIFPIRNTRGLVIAFGGRLLGDGQPKYLNSQDSRVFHKKDNLYALNLTRQDIAKLDQAILVEGYMDVISLYQNGVKNVTASLGTALTAEQAAIIKRYTSNVIIAYDSDQAGVKAALRGIDLLKNAGCSVKVLRLKGAKDPDEYIKSEGRERFLRLVEEAPTYIQYKLDLAKENNDIVNTEGRLAFLREAARILKSVSPVEADIYIRTTASDMNISEGALRAEVLGMTEGNKNNYVKVSSNGTGSGERSKTQSTHAPVGGSMLEKNFIRLILLSSRYFLEIKEYKHVFTAPVIQRIYEGIASLYEDDAEIDLKKLEDALDASDRRVLSDIMDNIRLSDQDEAVFAECVKTARLLGLTEKEEGIIALLNDSGEEREENRGRIRELTEELLRIQKDIREVKESR